VSVIDSITALRRRRASRKAEHALNHSAKTTNTFMNDCRLIREIYRWFYNLSHLNAMEDLATHGFVQWIQTYRPTEYWPRICLEDVCYS